jgi:phage/plasmid-like protein (TIGR03299 family)
MSHELQFRNGVASFFETRTKVITAWHSEGKPIDGDVKLVTEALALMDGNYPVDKRNTFWSWTDPKTGLVNVRQSDKAFTIVRADTGTELGRAGADYVPVQNAEHFALLQPMLDNGLLRIDCGGVLREGADAWILSLINLEMFPGIVQEELNQPGNEVYPYVVFTATHDGSGSNTVSETPIRVVCANTLAMHRHAVISRGISEGRIDHRGDVKAKMDEVAKNVFGDIVRRYSKIAINHKLLKGTRLTDDEFMSVVLDTAVPHPLNDPKFVPGEKQSAAVIERADRKRAEIKRAWHEGKGHQGDHSAWEAYNGLVEVVDHNKQLFPTRSGAMRCGSLMGGALREIKDTTLDALLEHCTDNNASLLDRIVERFSDSATPNLDSVLAQMN